MPILDERSLEFHSHSSEQTERLGVRLGELAEPGDLYCIAGDLGSGKTTFAKGVARGWGALDRATSPSFVLVHEYRRANSDRLYHVDAFRLESPEQAYSIGLTDLVGHFGPTMVEWPEKLRGLLPEECLWIRLRWMDEMRRELRFEARGARYERLLRQFRRAAFGA